MKNRRVIHEDIKATCELNTVLDEPGATGLASHGRLHGKHLRSIGTQGISQPGGLMCGLVVVHDNNTAAAGQRLTNGPPNPNRAARHQYASTFQVHPCTSQPCFAT